MVQIFVNARNRLRVIREMKIIVISAPAIVILLSAIIPNAMASQGYWTPYDSDHPRGMTAYHIFLDGTFPSYVDRSIKLVNQNLTACLEFNANETDPRPLVCHPIKESDIPQINDTIMDVGYFVVSDKLNTSAAESCVRVGYHNWYSCDTRTINEEFYYHSFPKLFYDMDGQIYNDVFANDACLTYHHLKEGTKDFDFCTKMLG
jgi:hypothetical protein